MFTKKLGLGIAVSVVALACASSASATNFAVGTPNKFYLTSGTPFTPSITANFGNGFSTAGSFDDSFLFTIPQNGMGSGSISTSFAGAGNKLTITDISINGVSYGAPPANSSGSSLSVNGIPIFNLVQNVIRVQGTTAGFGGTYAGTATFLATAVPETATWAMMLGGFGLIGASLRRRKVSFDFA